MRKNRKLKPVNWFLLGLIVLPLMTIAAYYWATNLISSLENYRSPLHVSAPEPGERLGSPITQKVVLVIFDALRYDTSSDATVMPILNSLRLQGASAVMYSRPPSFSAPGWTTLFTGAWPDLNDSQPMNPPDNDSTRSFTQDDIFAAADRSGLKTAVSGYIWFEKMLSDSGVDEGFFTSEEDQFADQDVVSNALPWLSADFQFILIHIDQIDFAGHHEGGPQDSYWNAAASRADALLGQILDQIDLEKDTLILLSDHGQIDKGGHGGNDKVTMVEPFIAIGKSILPGSYPDILMVDVAPTIAVLLGTNIPATNQGHPLLDMLDISPTARESITQALQHQQSTLLDAYLEAVDQDVSVSTSDDVVQSTQIALEQARLGRLARERIWRNLVAVFFCFIPGYIFYLRKDKRVLWFLIGALVYLLIFNLRYAILDKNPYTLSWIPGLTDFIIYIAITTIISLIPAWLVIMVGLKAFRLPPRQSSGIALSGIWFLIYVLLFAFWINFAFNGLLITWTLPEISILYFGFYAGVQTLFVSAIGLLLIGLSTLIARRNVKTID